MSVEAIGTVKAARRTRVGARLLKVALDVAFIFSLGWLAMLIVFAVVSIFGMVTGVDLPDWRAPNHEILPMFVTTGRGIVWLASTSLLTLGTALIIARLREVVMTVIEGDPFRIENARRLRTIGLVLAIVEAAPYPMRLALFWASPNLPNIFFWPKINSMALIGIVVLFIFAEVFERGVRMRQDIELTI